MSRHYLAQISAGWSPMRNEGSLSLLFKNPFRKPQLHFLPLTLRVAESLSVSLARVAYQLLKLLREGGSCLLVFESSFVTINPHHKPMRLILSSSPFYRWKKTGLEKSSDLCGKQLVHLGAGAQPRAVRPAAGTPNHSTVCVQGSERGPDPTLTCMNCIYLVEEALSPRWGLGGSARAGTCLCVLIREPHVRRLGFYVLALNHL